ncbi:MAG: galactosyltransferase-related protein [Pseudomonadota bacterium]
MPTDTICFVTTCRGRLAHLKQTLPLLVKQPGASVVVVDYDCPEKAGDWVEEAYPQVQVVRSGPAGYFELARARNLGAQAAKATQAPWLCFVDADAVLAPGFVEAIAPSLRPGHFYIAADSSGSISGMCFCTSADFASVGGYDVVLQGWGMEDKDLYRRLELAGVRLQRFPVDGVRMIPHGDDMRVRHYDLKRLQLSSSLNFVYCRAKWDLMSLGRQMEDEARRRELYELIGNGLKSAAEGGVPFRLRIPTSTKASVSGAVLSASLMYELGEIPPGRSDPATRSRPR